MDAVAHFTQLARYNVWATARVLDAVRALPEEAYRRDVGLFFKSIHGTLNHLLVGEHHLWFVRFAEGISPKVALDAELEPDRAQLDARWTGGWQGLQRQLQQAGWLAASATAPQAKVPAMALQAQLRVPQWSMAPVAAAGPRAQEAAALQLRDVRVQWQGDVAQWQLELQGLLRSGTHEVQTQAHVDGASQGAGAWALTLARWQTQWRDSTHPGPWAAQLPQPVALTLRHSARSGLALQLEPGQLHVSSPLPGRAQLQWEATQWSQPPQGGPMRLRTRGALRELPLAWVDALDSATPTGAEKRLERLGLATDVVLEGAWEVDARTRAPCMAKPLATHMAAHANTHDAHFANLCIANHFLSTQLRQHFFAQQIHGTVVVAMVHGKAEVGAAILAQVLDDHIHFNIGIRHRAQNTVSHTRGVRHAKHGNFGFAAVECDARYDGLFHFFVFLKGDQGA